MRSALRGVLVKWQAVPSIPAVALAAVLAVVYAPLWAGKLIYDRDVSRFLYPIRWFVRDSLERGDSPWWTPHIGLGHSMLADPQAALFYPVNLLCHLGPLPFMFMVVLLLHLLWGGIGMAFVARSFRLGRLAAIVSGVAWALSGYVTSLLTNGARLPSASWIPWQALLFVGVARAARDRQSGMRSVVGLAVASGMGYVAGDPFVAVMGQLLGLGLAVAVLATERPARRTHGSPPAPAPRAQLRLGARFVVMSALALGLAAMLAAAALVPAARALAGTERVGGLSAAAAQAGSLHPLRLAGFAAPEAFSRAWFHHPSAAWVGRYLEGAPLSLSVYFGGSVLTLVVLALAPWRRRDSAVPPGPDERASGGQASRTGAAAVAGVGLVFLIVALGHHTPLFGLLRAIVPPLAYMRAPEKWLLAVVPCTSLLAGWGAHRMTDPDWRPSWKWILCAPGVVLMLAMLAPLVFPADLGARVRQGAWHGLAACILAGAAWSMARRYPRLAGAFLLLVLIGDLSLDRELSLRFSDAKALREPGLVRLIRPLSAPGLPFPRLFRGSKVQLSASLASPGDPGGSQATLETLRDNISVPFGIAILPGYGVVTPPELVRLLDRGRLDALRLLATDHVLLSAPKAGGRVPEGLVPLSASVPGVRLYQVERDLPRVFASFSAARLPHREIESHLLDADVVAGRLVLLDEGQPWNGGQRPPRPPVPCRIEVFTNVLERVTCDVPSAGLAVFVEQHAAGWSASVDKVPAPLLRANALMRAVPLPAGRHSVEVSFSPPGLRTGAMLSLFGLVVTILLMLADRAWLHRLRTREPPVPELHERPTCP